jgi:hypothetical protein
MRNSTRLLVLASLALLPLGAQAPRGDELRFAPAKGLRLAKSYELEASLAFDSMRLIVDGSEHESPRQPPRRETERTTSIAFVDEYVAVEAGAIAELVREFGAIAQTTHMEMGDGSRERADSSALTGHKVRFAQTEAGEPANASWVDEGADDALLDGLALDADALGCLPAGPVSEGETWDVPVAAFRRLIEPGGDLQLAAEDAEADEAQRAQQRELDDSMQGEITATYLGLREEDGRKLAAIRIEAKVALRAEGEAPGRRGGPPSQRLVEIELEYEGELHWDAAAGHLAGYELHGDQKSKTTNTSESTGSDGVTRSVVREQLSSGKNELRAVYAKQG